MSALTELAVTTVGTVCRISIDRIHPNPAPIREHLDGITPEVMAALIDGSQCLIVRLARTGGYNVVLGHDVLRAARQDGSTLVDALVLIEHRPDPFEALVDGVAGRIFRGDIAPLEEAGLFHLLTQRFTVAEIAYRVGKAVTYIRWRLDLLDLSPAGQTALNDGRLPVGLASYIARLRDESQQDQFLGRWLAGEWTAASPAVRAAQEVYDATA
ncbi:ParB/RepB/Spo0J family partition protein [Streptomyces sp. NPDC056708]|uniref:ParB/RepB/Spo0J family partition protein n=1 Tax=unclassified Streptomyces TaxID=2593676 RepID=UPI00368D4226